MKKCAVINDISGFGKCSLTAAIPVMAAMQVQVNPVVTSILSHQTDFDIYKMTDTSEFMDELIDGWVKNGVREDAILTGFIANAAQIERIERFIDVFKNDENILVVDPVMGDDGRVYDNYTDSMIDGVRRLSEKADIITPNAMELCLLAKTEFTSDIARLEKLAQGLLSKRLKCVMVTGIKNHGDIATLTVTKDGSYSISVPYLKGSYSGTGDIFASVVTAGIIQGMSPKDAAALAAGFISKSIEVTDTKDRREGVCFEKQLGWLSEQIR